MLVTRRKEVACFEAHMASLHGLLNGGQVPTDEDVDVRRFAIGDLRETVSSHRTFSSQGRIVLYRLASSVSPDPRLLAISPSSLYQNPSFVKPRPSQARGFLRSSQTPARVRKTDRICPRPRDCGAWRHGHADKKQENGKAHPVFSFARHSSVA